MTVKEYLENLNHRYKQGTATEHTFRGDLQELIQSLVPSVLATNEPKRIKCGAPDYLITKKNSQIPIGYIEAKDIGIDLKSKTLKEQFDRYRESLENLIITDYLIFQLFIEGEFKYEIRIGEISNGKIVYLEENFLAFEAMIRSFCEYSGQTIRSPQKLATMMADKAKMLQHIIESALNSDDESNDNSTLKDQMKAFRELLIHDIDVKGFADLYAQTIAYGMFAARLEDTTLATFSRQEAAELIPKSNPFLRKLFQYIAGYDLDERIVWIVDALADVFRATDIKELLKNFGKTTQMHDPIIHFYEDFLVEYDPSLRKKRGVWYTPAPVVSFIVKSMDEVLRKEFGMPLGIADYSKTKIKVQTWNTTSEREVHKTQILDPATGTGTFLSEVVRFIYSKYFEKNQGAWSSYVEEHLIPRLHGFELLMTSYAMAHLKLEMLLKETGYEGNKTKRLGVYLTNSLEEHHPDMNTLFAGWLSEEANSANFVKRDTPVMCVLGNPPYSGESSNKGNWIMKLMEDYKMEPGGKEKLNERNPKWINDDYVKFIRYAQHYIDKNNEGVLAYINPHGFLDNPTFRGMRWKLLSSFDKIYVIDLHGNSKKKEVCPDGSPDYNVFNIQQGVSINIFVKTGAKKKNQLAEVYHTDCYGTRDVKFDFLNSNSLETIPFVKIENIAPDYYFIPMDFSQKKSYDKGFSIAQLFEVNSAGIVTARDPFSIHFDKRKLEETIKEFLTLGVEEARTKFNLRQDVRDWSVSSAKQDLSTNNGSIQKIAYRIFDDRYTIYTGVTKGFHCMPRKEVMNNFIRGINYGIAFCKQVKSSEEFYHCHITNKIMESSYVSNRTGEITYVAPLYIYSDESQQDMFSFMSGLDRKPNLKTEIIKEIAQKLNMNFTNEKEIGETFAPIDVLDYIYGVLHSPSYREKYKEFLKIDYPKVPYPKNKKEFLKFVEIGTKLRTLHLMENLNLSENKVSFPIGGSNMVEKMTYDNGKVYINDEQYFENVSDIAWNFYVGGYQPAQKWLKDRKRMALGFEEINHYINICYVLKETDRLMKELG